MTRRRWIADEVHADRALLLGQNAQHLERVLRAQVGQEFDVAADGQVRVGKIVSISDDRVEFELREAVAAGPTLDLTLLTSVFKFDRMEWAIEKATELGVAAIVPVIARRTDKHLAHAAMRRAERWRRIAHEASQQSRRSDVPAIEDPTRLAERVKAASSVQRVVLAEQERGMTLRGVLEEAIAKAGAEMPELEIAIGPEGGWAPEEAALFDANGWRAASLGPRILRAETAAIAALAVIGSMME